MAAISFRLKYIVKNIGFKPDFPIQLIVPTDNEVTVEIRPVTESEINNFIKLHDFVCIAELKKKPTSKIAQWLIDTTEQPPSGFTDFAKEASDLLYKAILNALNLLRWRIGYRDAPDPLKLFYSFQWSVENGTWIPVPDQINLKLDAGIAFYTINEEIVKSVQDLLRNKTSEPLAQELFQEAWSERDNNPKSSLVMCVAAAETGIKHLISRQVPALDWFIKETQSPPLVKLLEEYLPLLPTRVMRNKSPLPPLPLELILEMKKAVHLRNEIVHGKEVGFTGETLKKILETVHDLLYFFDLYEGRLWAVDNMSIEMTQIWLGKKPDADKA